MPVAIPSTGTTWKGAGLGEVDNRFYSRGGLAAILIRDNRGSATNISPYVDDGSGDIIAGWSPFAQDGTLRDDLFYTVKVNGEWVTNPNANEGFWLVGAVTEDGGVEREPKLSHDDAKILQSNNPFDTDITEDGMMINFTGVETLKPLLKRLKMNLPLSDAAGNPIVEDPGQQNFTLSKPVDADTVDRQVILIFARRKAGKFIYSAEGYSLTKLTDVGKFTRSKTNADAAQLTFTVLPDPYMMDKDPTVNPDDATLIPVLYTEWTAGDGWTAIGGVPVFPGAAPVATTTAATTATVAFTAATGGGDPFSYTVERAIGPSFSSWVAATVGSTSGTTSVTLGITGLTTATSYKFRVTATGQNGNSAVSTNSNSITTS